MLVIIKESSVEYGTVHCCSFLTYLLQYKLTAASSVSGISNEGRRVAHTGVDHYLHAHSYETGQRKSCS